MVQRFFELDQASWEISSSFTFKDVVRPHTGARPVKANHIKLDHRPDFSQQYASTIQKYFDLKQI